MLKTLLDFILNEQRLYSFFFALLWLGPLFGLLGGAVVGIQRKHLSKNLLKGLCFGLLTTVISLLWYLYNAIMDHYGLDSVKGLLINLFLFALIGFVGGFFYRFTRTKGSD